jgi:peptide/nickel transport system substrate-binding protein
MAMNNKKQPIDDLRVRQAIAYAIDRKAIIDGAMNGLGTPIGSHLTPNDPGYVDLTGQYPHDPEKSKALLKAAGVKLPLELTLTLPPPDYARKGGEIAAAELAEVGIQAKIENVEWAQWISNVYTAKNYDLTIISHVEPLDIGIYARPGYYFNYNDPQFDAIIARLSTAPDIDAYKKALVEAQHNLADHCVNAFLFQLANVVIADANLKGVWKNAPIFANDLSALSWK